MGQNIKSVFILLAFVFIFFPPAKCFAQENTIPQGAYTEEPGEEYPKKKKKDGEDTFFQLRTDKLSSKFFTRMGIDLASAIILICLIYFPNYRKKDQFFTFFIFNFVIFLISYFLNKVDMGIGAAFGLFAVFSMLRYRTENISTKDMTYLFLTIAIGLVTAISKVSAIELCILNSLILLSTFCMEGRWLLKKESSQLIQYENIELITPENSALLIADLKKRTGLNIHRVTFEKLDFLKDTALIRLYYYE